MPRRLALFASFWCFLLSGVGGALAQDYTFQVPSDPSGQASMSQAWIDTGLELQPGDVLQIAGTAASSGVPDRHALAGAAACEPAGVAGSATANLPLPGAPQGALIARLHAQGAAPILVGASNELHIEESSRLYLGMNFTGAPSCQGGLSVKVHRIAQAQSSGTTASSTPAEALVSNTNTPANAQTATGASTTGQSQQTQQTRGQQLKSQLSSAAQVFMAGQFGIGKSEASGSNAAVSGESSGTTASATPLIVSETPLDEEFRRNLDSLPRRVNDQFQNLGDMVNFVIVGSQKDVQAALDAASWHVADTSNSRAVLNAVMQTYDSKDYLAMPMSTLYLFGRKQDFGYEMAEPIAMVASRHHFRIWKAPFTWKGSEVWVGAGTHDIGFAKDKRNGNVTHKIDPSVDGERDNIGASLQKTNKAKLFSYYLPPNPVQEARNATGDGYHSDGRLLVVFLK